jgi:DNA polymerase III sliding clamp (beta) subunit (PCNA family)
MNDPHVALELRRELQSEDPIRLPAELPPPLAELPPEVEPAPPAEQVTKNELRLMEERKSPPPPDRVLENAPFLKPSVVAPVQLNGNLFLQFLDALTSVAKESADVPIRRNVLLTYTEGELRLEATDDRVWAIARMKAHGGRDGFECVVPLKRARNIVRRMLARYPAMSLGVDGERVHLGDYSFPHGGNIRDFPKRPILLPEELKAALPSLYLHSILERLVGVIDPEHEKPELRGVHLDFEAGVAVATDGYRIHMLGLTELEIVTRKRYRRRPALTLTVELFEYLRSVTERQWVPLVVNEKMVTAAGEDFGVMARPIDGAFVDWQKCVRRDLGYWLIDKAALIETVKDALAVSSESLELAVDSIGEQLILTAYGPGREVFRRSLRARRKGGLPALRCCVNPQYLRYAIESVEGGLVRLGFDDHEPTRKPIMVRGEPEDFLAAVMPRTLHSVD